MINRQSAHPIGTGLGIEDPPVHALRVPFLDRPPGWAGRTVESGLRHERPNRGTVACACRWASPVI
jgi:hypothetical protein